jgi:hypothetical protein
MPTHIRGKREVFLLGKLLLAQKPDIARELLSDYENKKLAPIETDIDKLPVFLGRFCILRSIHSLDDHSRGIRKTRNLNEQRYFMATMLHLYSPELFNGYKEKLYPGNGFVNAVSRLMKLDPSQGSHMIREVVTLERVYEDFRERVEELVIGVQVAE